jgi:hypothetical protein
MGGVVFALLFVAGAVAGYWLLRRSRGAATGAEDRLLRICRGNTTQAARLIQGEMDRSPGISDAEAASRAVERYLRDNR